MGVGSPTSRTGAYPSGAPVMAGTHLVLSSKARDTFRHVTEPAGQALAKAGITANSLTAIGLAGSLGAGALIATGQPEIGGAVSLLSGLPDMLDGAVAKASGRVSRRGAFLDSVVDRLSDAAVLGGIVWLASVRGQARLPPAAGAGRLRAGARRRPRLLRGRRRPPAGAAGQPPPRARPGAVPGHAGGGGTPRLRHLRPLLGRGVPAGGPGPGGDPPPPG